MLAFAYFLFSNENKRCHNINGGSRPRSVLMHGIMHFLLFKHYLLDKTVNLNKKYRLPLFIAPCHISFGHPDSSAANLF